MSLPLFFCEDISESLVSESLETDTLGSEALGSDVFDSGALDTSDTLNSGALDTLEALDSGVPDTLKRIEISLSYDEARHMGVLRIKPGEHIRLSDGRGMAVEAVVIRPPVRSSATKDPSCEVELVSVLELPYRPNVTLVQGVSKGERMDLLVRQAVELGVRRIIPAMTARCIVSLDSSKRESRVRRWRAVALSAAKQSGQPVLPTIDVPMDLSQAITEASSADVLIVPWEECNFGSIADCLRDIDRNSKVFLFVGPEGGFEASEIEQLCKAGAKTVTLGDLILRTETAGVIASALAIYELGGLGNSLGTRRSSTAAPAWGTIDV